MIKRLSATGIKCFKACRRAYQLKYVYGLTPVQTSDALETGTQYHKLIEDFYKDGTVPALDSKEASMVHAYFKYIYPVMPEFEPEVDFECVCGGRDNILTGRIDGRVCGGVDAIVEHKTTSLDVDEFEFNLQWDEQLLTYFLATGCQTAYYTVCKKPTIRQKQSETPEEFAQRCLDWYSEDTNNKIRLLEITCAPEDIKAHKKQLWKMFTEIKHAQKHNNFYRNPCNCNSWGRPCEYKPICLNYNPNEKYVGFERRDN